MNSRSIRLNTAFNGFRKINMNGKMAPHLYGAVYLILRKADKILLMNRANTGWMDGHFSLPSGHMKPVRKDFP